MKRAKKAFQRRETAPKGPSLPRTGQLHFLVFVTESSDLHNDGEGADLEDGAEEVGADEDEEASEPQRSPPIALSLCDG